MANLDEIARHVLAACEGWGIDRQCVVIAHGSRVEGFANADSDVDLWVVSPPGLTPPLLPVFEWVSGFRVQPESLSWDSLGVLANRINALDIGRNEDVLSVSARDVDLYYRVATSIPLFGADQADDLKRQFHCDRVASLFARRCGIAAATELRKAEVYRAARDRFEESLCLQRAVEWALDSHLAANGEAYPNRKWRFEKLRRRFGTGTPLFRDAWQLKSLPPLQTLSSYRRRCYRLIRSLDVPFEPQKVAPKRLRRGEIVRVGGRTFLVVPDTAVYLLAPHGAVLWELADGQNTCDDLINRMTSAEASRREAADIVFGWLAECRSHGLIDLHPIDEL